jgi:AraC-like DNA-binding protein
MANQIIPITYLKQGVREVIGLRTENAFGQELRKCFDSPCSSSYAGGTQRSQVLISFEPFTGRAETRSISDLSCRPPQAGVLGLLGVGEIGEFVARKARISLDVQIHYCGCQAAGLERECGARPVDMATLLRTSDVVCLVLPSAPEVSDWLGRREIETLPLNKLFIARRRSEGIERALAHLSENYAERIRIGELAARAGLSEFHFQRRFNAVLGITPHRYQVMLRIFHAKLVLRGGASIGDVATSVGFADQSHLHRYFRRMVGVTPGQYQRTFCA